MKEGSTIKPNNIFAKFSLFFFKKQGLSLVLWLIILVSGIGVYERLIQREGFPSVQVPIGVINVSYFVNNQTEVDQKIAQPISQSLKNQTEVKEVRTSANANFANVLIYYQEGVDSAKGLNSSRNILSSINLPPQAKLDYINIDAAKYNAKYSSILAVYQTEPDTSNEALKLQAENVAQTLGTIEGVKISEIIPQDSEALDPVSGLKKSITSNFDYTGISDAEMLKFYHSYNIGVIYHDDQDVLKMSELIQDKIAGLDQSKYQVRVVADFAPDIKEQISSLEKNMLEGFIVICFISFALITWRAGLAIALSMLSVIFATVIVLYLIGQSLNVITLFSLILSLGLIVDDATIAAESIDAHKKISDNKNEIIAVAIGKIARASTTGTLVTILAFAPMLFINGILGSFIRAIPITIIISLVFSLIFSISIIPFLSKHLILKKKIKDNFIQRLEKKASSFLAKIIVKIPRNKFKAFALILFFVLISFFATMAGGQFFSKVGFDIFPKEKDSTSLVVNLQFSDNLSVSEAQEKAKLVNKVIQDNSMDIIAEATYLSSGESKNATIELRLTPIDERDITAPVFSKTLQTKLDQLTQSGIYAFVATQGAGGPSSTYPLNLQVFGNNTKQNYQALEKIISSIESKELQTRSKTTFRVNKHQIVSPIIITTRIDGNVYVGASMGFDKDSNTEIIEEAKTTIEEVLSQNPEFKNLDIKFDAGSEDDNQDSFKSMLIAFPILLGIIYLLLVMQFKNLILPIVIFLAIPFSFLGVGAGLYYTNNSFSFFVMLGFFALIGIALNNTILLVDQAKRNQKMGMNIKESVAEALKIRFRPLVATSMTSVVALTPLALNDPFWQSLSITLIFGLISSTLLVIISFPYYLIIGLVVTKWLKKLLRLRKK